MKKFLATTALALLVTASTFASDIKVGKKVLETFRSEFATATNPTWEMLQNKIYHAHFTYNNQVMDAYFEVSGELISFGRSISANELPILVSRTINEKFSGYTIIDASEYVVDNESSYVITAETDKKLVLARVFPNGSTQIIRKTKKS